MKKYYRELISKRLESIFEEQDLQTVLTWLVSNDGRLPVVVVGAGFTRNAENSRTGLPATWVEVPLWEDILRQFSNDLAFNTSRYDALALAELHFEEMGAATFNSTLLESLKDGELIPGKAHRALFGYPTEAVITTNFLDTLLDKNKREWVRVVRDADLALRKGDRSKSDLIYFHGHRSDPTSWVVTRSQYEDLAKSRPVLVTRVRQLLSQHPVLVVGYGLGDPDFHHIYRQLSLDMVHQPLGLALFPSGNRPPTPERRHWEKLGLRVATFKEGKSTTESFETFFGISPSQTGASSRSAPRESLDAVESWVSAETDFAKRLAKAEDFLTDSRRSDVVDTGQDKEYALWLLVLRGEFSEERWNDICAIHIDDFRYDQTSSSPAPQTVPTSSSAFRGFRKIPATRFSTQSELPRQIDAVLELPNRKTVEVARWMTFAFEQELLGHEPEIFVDLLSWLWMVVVKDSRGAREREEGIGIIRRCIGYAIKNEDEHLKRHVEEDATAVGIDITTISAAEGYPAELIVQMRKGYQGILDGAFADAEAAYREAGEQAQRQGYSFATWVALRGERQAWAASREIWTRMESGWSSQAELYRRRLEALEDTPRIKKWLSEARDLRLRVMQRVIEDFVEERRRALTGGISRSFNREAHDYWAMFRELEILHAPPAWQARFLKPLIDLGAFDAAPDLQYRLELDADGTEKSTDWLARVTDNVRLSLAESTALHSELLAEFRKEDSTRSRQLKRLLTFSSISKVFHAQDLAWAPSFLNACREKFGATAETHKWFRSLSDVYPKAWRCYAELETNPRTALDHLANYAAAALSPLEKEALCNEAQHLPLEEWIGLDGSIVPDLFELLLGLRSADEGISESDEPLAWALGKVVDGVKRFELERPVALWKKAGEWAERLLGKSLSEERSYRQGVFRAAVHLACSVCLDDANAMVRIVDVALKQVREPDVGAADKFAFQGALGIWSTLVDKDIDTTLPAMSDVGQRLWNRLQDTWLTVRQFIESNPHYAGPYTQFLVQAIKAGLASPAEAAPLLMEVVTASPRTIVSCAPLLAPEFWGNEWPRFVDLLLASSSGSTADDPVAARVGVTELLRHWLYITSVEVSLHTDLRFLFEVNLSALLDVSPAVANRAAYNIVAYASRLLDREDTRRVALALRRIAEDPRLAVRGAAAYAGAMLERVADDALRTLAQDLDRRMAEEPYARIQRQRRFGEIEARRRSPSTGTPDSAGESASAKVEPATV